MSMNRIQFQKGLSLPDFLERFGTEIQCKRSSAPPMKKIPPTASCDFLIRRNDGRYIKMASAY